jgi:hypothetical protein
MRLTLKDTQTEILPSRHILIKRYIDLYQLHDFKTVLRGTLRYQGFSFFMAAVIEIGLFSTQV